MGSVSKALGNIDFSVGVTPGADAGLARHTIAAPAADSVWSIIIALQRPVTITDTTDHAT